METMPICFRRCFGKKVAIVIDCFEIFIQRPLNLDARSKTWSRYKQSNTAKLLLGISPQGLISFISNAWGGRASDKYIAENSGLLCKILPGDELLADRGFNIHESVGVYRAEGVVPAYTKGKKQLTCFEVQRSRNIVIHCRIHVERVIGLLRNKYTICQSTIPLDYLMKRSYSGCFTHDKIVKVCCALCNLCESVVPFN